MTSKSPFRSLRKSRIFIAVKELRDAQAPINSSSFKRQIFCLLRNSRNRLDSGRSAIQIIKQHFRKRGAFLRVRTISSASDFSRAVREEVCIVDFYTRWFPVTPQRLSKLDSFTKELCPQATVVMVDLDAAPLLTMKLSIVVLPTLLIYANGVIQGRCVGGYNRRQLETVFGTMLSKQELGESNLELGKSKSIPTPSPQRS